MNDDALSNGSWQQAAAIDRIDPAQFPLSEMDRLELRERRGLTEATINFCQFGSVKNQAQLLALGLDWDFDALPSTILIPYLATRDETGRCRYRLHKRSLPGTPLPPYVLSRPDAKDVVLVESEFKAAAAWQLGYSAIGLQGIHSHLRRIDEIVAIAKQLKENKQC